MQYTEEVKKVKGLIRHTMVTREEQIIDLIAKTVIT